MPAVTFYPRNVVMGSKSIGNSSISGYSYNDQSSVISQPNPQHDMVKALRKLLAVLQHYYTPGAATTAEDFATFTDMVLADNSLSFPDIEDATPDFDDLAVYVGTLTRDLATRSQVARAQTSRSACGLYKIHKARGPNASQTQPERMAGAKVFLVAKVQTDDDGKKSVQFRLTDANNYSVPWDWAWDWDYVRWKDGSLSADSYEEAMRMWDAFVRDEHLGYNIECAVYFARRHLLGHDSRIELCREADELELGAMLLPLNFCRDACLSRPGRAAETAHARLGQGALPGLFDKSDLE